MKKNIVIRIGVLLFAILSFASCDDILDINRDPSYPAEASTQTLFSSGTTWSAAVLGSDVQLTTSLWSQHYAQNNTSQQYASLDFYSLANNSSYISRYWNSLYAGALPDLKRAISQAEGEGAWDYWIGSKVMIAYDYNMLACLFEKIPFSEALQGKENENPKYDEGKDVDKGIVAILDEAIAKEKDTISIPEPKRMGKKDLVFDGIAVRWVEFAKTLKLKVLMRDFAANQAAIEALLNEGRLLTRDAKLAKFLDLENKSNPLYENDRRKLNTDRNIRVSATLISYLNAKGDPRVGKYAEPATRMFSEDGSEVIDVPKNLKPYYKGFDNGAYGYYNSNIFPIETHSRARLEATDPVYFISAADSYFMQAEAYARLGNVAKAKEKYDEGVTAAFARWELDAEKFIAAGGAYEFKSGSLDEMLRSIIMQKWVSSVRTDAWHAFFDINRTGIPAIGTEYVSDENNLGKLNPKYVVGDLAPSIRSVLLAGQYPRRYLFPKNSADNNSNTPKLIPIYEKMWWHKK